MLTLISCILTFCNQAVPNQEMTCSKCVTQAVYDQRFQVAYHLKDVEQSDDSSNFSVLLEAKISNAPSTHDTKLDKKPASRKQKPRLFFTPEEDIFLQQGLRKYSFGNWQKMLYDKELHFQKGRNQDAMKKRAGRRFPELK